MSGWKTVRWGSALRGLNGRREFLQVSGCSQKLQLIMTQSWVRESWCTKDGNGAGLADVQPNAGVLIEEDFAAPLLGLVGELLFAKLAGAEVQAVLPGRRFDVLGRSGEAVLARGDG